FEEQVERTPGAAAVVFAGRSLSYSALNRWANRLAHWLRRQGVGPETPVAICVERSFAMMAALLGVLKAGGAYLPIDPRTPPERRAFMLDECGADVLLTQESLAGELGRPGLRTLCLDAGEDAVAGESAANPGVAVDPESTIALFYTSGSTGRPKATVERAAGMLNTCLWFRESAGMTESTGVLIIADFSFDVFFKNAFTPLLAGGRVVLANPGPYDPAELWAAVRDEKPTVVNGVASVLFPVLEIAAEDGFASVESLEMIQLGGEATVWSRLRPWIASGRCHCAIGNAYGPSECSDTVSLHMASWEEIASQGSLPIGRPADNVRMTVVDAAFQPQPVGAPGELCIGGECVARGYFGRPDLTAEKFVPDPMHPGARMYRTGDLGRWRPDGQLEYLG